MRKAILVLSIFALVVSTSPARAQSEKTLAKCAKTVASETGKYGASYVKAVGGCLDKISKAVIQNGRAIGTAAPACVSALRKVANTDASDKELGARATAKIGKACDPDVDPRKILHLEVDILGTSGDGEDLNAQNLDTWCQNFGVAGGINDLDDWVTCLLDGATCQARQSLATRYPRALEWLDAMRLAIEAGESTPATIDALLVINRIQLALDPNDDSEIDLTCGPGAGDGPCAAGQERALGVCTNCSAGRENPDGLGSCTPCPTGEFSAGAGQACTKCPQGRFAGSVGLSTCEPCDSGFYQDSEGASSCTSCAKGTVSSIQGASSCQECPVGRVAATVGLSTCSKCQAGKFQGATGASACEKCDPGTVSSFEGSQLCDECGAGTFAPSAGQTTCINCPSGRATAQTGSSTCSLCAPGTVASSQGLSSCADCAMGKFQAVAGQTTCQNCPVDTYNPTTGMKVCLPCPGVGAGAATCDCAAF